MKETMSFKNGFIILLLVVAGVLVADGLLKFKARYKFAYNPRDAIRDAPPVAANAPPEQPPPQQPTFQPNPFQGNGYGS